MVFKAAVYYGIHATQVIFSIIALGLSAGVRAKISYSTSWLNYFIFVAVTSFLAAAALLIAKCTVRPSSRGLDVAYIVVSAVWSIFWLAAIASYAAKGGLGSAVAQVYGADGYYSVLGYQYTYGTDSHVAAISKAGWSFGLFLLLLWLACLLCYTFDFFQGGGGGATAPSQPQAYPAGGAAQAGPAGYPPPKDVEMNYGQPHNAQGRPDTYFGQPQH